MLHHRVEGRRDCRPKQPVIVRDVLHHRAQADQQRIGGERRDRVDDIGRLEIDPADHAAHEPRGARHIEHEAGLGDGRRRLHQNRAVDAVAREQRREIIRHEVAVDRPECRRQPSVVAAVDAPEMLVRIDHAGTGAVSVEQPFALQVGPERGRHARGQAPRHCG